jgi:hypothetical protein
MHPSLEVRDTGRYGLGVFAKATIAKGTTLFVCGGPILTLADEDNLPPKCADKCIEISEWFSMGPRTPEEIPLMPQQYVNHSCDPNAGWHGQLFMVAMRVIHEGEEICYDYAMVMQSNEKSATYWTMPCHCKQHHCRGRVTEDDWLRPELQTRYNGWFAWHIQEKIDAGRIPRRSTPDLSGGGLMVSDGRRSGFHWMDSRITKGQSYRGGLGCVAKDRIPARTLAFAFGGWVMRLREEMDDFALQISETHVLGVLDGELDDADFVNHSCSPNLGFLGQVFLVTLRDIAPNEELCFDYAMCLGGGVAYSLPCSCGSPNCRGTITHLDWLEHELQRKYEGHFQYYLDTRMKRKMPHHNFPVLP